MLVICVTISEGTVIWVRSGSRSRPLITKQSFLKSTGKSVISNDLPNIPTNGELCGIVERINAS